MDVDTHVLSALVKEHLGSEGIVCNEEMNLPYSQVGIRDMENGSSPRERVVGAAAVSMGIYRPSIGTMLSEAAPLVSNLHCTNTTTLGDMLDPTYMDPALWSSLPMHIVELILSKVPFRNLVTMRRVCKYWNELILSEGFSPPFVPALIMFARTPTVRKMMLERNQPVPKEKEPRKGRIFCIWRITRRLFKRKPSVMGQ